MINNKEGLRGMGVDTCLAAPTSTTVNMAQIAFIAKPDRARVVVGSCIGLALYHARQGVGALGHIVLPKSNGRSAKPGKFADTAIPYMIDQLNQKGANTAGLVAKISGGSSMFGGNGPLQIGRDNADAVRELLAKHGVTIIAEHLGGSKGRRLTFDCSTGDVLVEIVGKDPETL